jgi:hypothetical protein
MWVAPPLVEDQQRAESQQFVPDLLVEIAVRTGPVRGKAPDPSAADHA